VATPALALPALAGRVLATLLATLLAISDPARAAGPAA